MIITLYAKKVKGGVEIFNSNGRKYCFYPRDYYGCPIRTTKRITLNCYNYLLKWL